MFATRFAFSSGALVKSISAAVLMFATSGCAALTGYPDASIDPKQELGSLAPYLDSATVIANYNALSDAARGGVGRREYRDQIVYARIRAADINYTEFKKALVKDNSVFDIGTDWLVLGLNAVGATTGGAETKAALHAASGGIVGARGAVDKELFYQKTLPAIIAQMDAGRATARVTIENGLREEIDKYPLPKAIVDLGNYETAGSIPAAISAIVADAGAKSSSAAHEFTILRNEDFVKNREASAAILERVAALTPGGALSVAKQMEPHLAERDDSVKAALQAMDPNKTRLSDGTRAKAFLQRWVVLDERTATFQKQWQDALDAPR